MTRTRDNSLIRRQREREGLSVSELADLLDRSPAFVSNMEGGFVPSRARREQVARVLRTTPEQLWPSEDT